MYQPDVQPLFVVPHQPEVQVTPYTMGALGRLIELHAQVYHQLCGFDSNFEIFVARELATFLEHFDPRCDALWLYKEAGCVVGCVAIDGHDAYKDGARLRFLIVDPHYQKRGIGHQLMQKAITFCKDRAISRIFLWTTPALVEARKLYDTFGFKLVEEQPHTGWGTTAIHQKFELSLNNQAH